MVAAVCAWSEVGLPHIEKLSILGGKKGIALVLTLDAPYDGPVSTESKALSRTAWLVHVRVPGVQYGLEVKRFTSLPSQSPVTEISARERTGQDTTDIVLEALVVDGDKVEAKATGNRVLVLISREPVKRFTWSAPGAAEGIREGFRHRHKEPRWAPERDEAPTRRAASAKPPAGEKPPEERLACLERVRVIQRGDVAELSFELSESVTPHIRYQSGRAVLLFPRAANCTGDGRLEPSTGNVFKSIELRHRTHGGKEWLGAIVTLGEDARLPFVSRQQGGATHIMVKPAGGERFTYWASNRQEGVDVAFAQTHASMERRPEEGVMPGWREEMETESADRYFVTIGDNVNIRSEPETGTATNIVARLDRGATVALIEKRGAWRRVRTEAGVAGWVYGALLTARSAAQIVRQDEALSSRSIQAVRAGASLPSAKATAPSIAQAPPEAGPASAKDSPAQPSSAQAQAVSSLSGSGAIRYASYGRDPFMPYSRKIDEGLPSPENLILVGILYDRNDRIALLQDELFKEKSYALREHDPVSHGTLWRITPTSAIFLITELGISRTYTLELKNVSPTKEQRR